jgi:hypothetical protein
MNAVTKGAVIGGAVNAVSGDDASLKARPRALPRAAS